MVEPQDHCHEWDLFSVIRPSLFITGSKAESGTWGISWAIGEDFKEVDCGSTAELWKCINIFLTMENKTEEKSNKITPQMYAANFFLNPYLTECNDSLNISFASIYVVICI